MPFETLSVGEFTRAMDRLHQRFDKSEERLDNCVTDIAEVRVLLTERTDGERKSTRNSASGWSAGVAGVIIGGIELAKFLVK